MGLLPSLRKRTSPGHRLVRLTGDLAIGSHSRAPGDVQRLSRMGFRSIVNLAHEGEPGQTLSPNVEATWAHTFDLEHRRLSVCPRPSSADLDRFLSYRESLPRPVFVHSTGGSRAAAFGAIALALEQGLTAEAVLEELSRRGFILANERLRSLVREEIERRAARPALPGGVPAAGRGSTARA